MACDTSCQDDKAKMTKALSQLLDYRRKLSGRLKNERPADANELLSIRKWSSSIPAGLFVAYFDFGTWLWRFDENLTRGLQVNINSYKYQRDEYINNVRRVLGSFSGMDTVKALGNAMAATKRKMTLVPYFNFDDYPKLPFKTLGLNSAAYPAGDPGGGDIVPGAIDDAIVVFSPELWSRDGKPGSFGYSGPGSDADQVLFHELLHGLRIMEGVNAAENKTNDGYGNEEEFIAIVLANIYMAEMGKMKLRKDHQGFEEMPQPDFFLKNPQYRTLLRNFKNKARAFYNDLANIPVQTAWWNPVRELRDAEG